jgi:hypothetical protein
VFTRARGWDAVFWQSPRTRKQARPAEVRAWARDAGLTVADRSRLHPDISAAWHNTHAQDR